MTKPKWLEISEYAALGASAVGTVAAVVSQQVIYAAAPLMLTIGLNLVERQKFNQLNQLPDQTKVVNNHYDHRYSNNGGGIAVRGTQQGGELIIYKPSNQTNTTVGRKFVSETHNVNNINNANDSSFKIFNAETFTAKNIDSTIHNHPQQHNLAELEETARKIEQFLAELQTQGYSPKEAQEKAASSLATQAKSNLEVKNKLMRWKQYLGDRAASGVIGEVAVNVIKLALQSSGIPMP